MIPYLFPSDSLVFTGSGYGALSKAVSCTVKQELGSTGVYELEMEILTDDPNFKNMSIGKIIVAKPNLTDENQAFVIESLSKPINNVVTVYATHIAQHRARLIPVAPVTATDLQDALSKIATNSLETNPFSLHSDRVTATAYTTEKPMSFREILGGTEGSLLDVYGGEYIFNNLDIELVSKRGRTNGIQVAYGQNMTDFQMDEEFSYAETVTGILPYWFDEEEGLIQGSIQYSDYVDYFKYHKTVAVDYTDDFEVKPTAAELEAKALSDVRKAGFPKTNIKVSFNEFDDVIKGNTMIMQLGDEVRVINSNYGVNSTARICSMTFNVLADRYDEIQVGSLQDTINDAISDTVGDVEAKGGGASPFALELLWTNPNPAQSFSAGSVAVNLTDYDMIYIKYDRVAGTSTYNVGAMLLKNYQTISVGIGGGKIITRTATADNTGVTFTNGQIYNTYGTATGDSSYMIPYQIYGISGSHEYPNANGISF